MKKVLSVIMLVVMLVSLCSCAAANSGNNDGDDATTTPQNIDVVSPVADDENYITKDIDDCLMISYPANFNETSSAGTIFAVADETGLNSIGIQKLDNPGVTIDDLNEEAINAIVDGVSSQMGNEFTLGEIKNLTFGNGKGVSFDFSGEVMGIACNFVYHLVLNADNSTVYYVIFMSMDENMDAFDGAMDYVFIK